MVLLRSGGLLRARAGRSVVDADEGPDQGVPVLVGELLMPLTASSVQLPLRMVDADAGLVVEAVPAIRGIRVGARRLGDRPAVRPVVGGLSRLLVAQLEQGEQDREVLVGPLRFLLDLEAGEALRGGRVGRIGRVVFVEGSDGLGGLPPGETPR